MHVSPPLCTHSPLSFLVLSLITKVACPRDGASGSHARAKGACDRGGQGSAAVPPPSLARAFVRDDPIVDEEEALE